MQKAQLGAIDTSYTNIPNIRIAFYEHGKERKLLEYRTVDDALKSLKADGWRVTNTRISEIDLRPYFDLERTAHHDHEHDTAAL